MFKRKYIFIVIITLLLIGSFSSSFVFAEETDVDAQSLVAKLQEQIKVLQFQVAELQSQLEAVKTELKFDRTLTRGLQGDDIKQLQEFLKTMPDIYPEGKVTGFFGPLTEAAVRRFQEKNNIESVGFVGPKTLSRLNERAVLEPTSTPTSPTTSTPTPTPTTTTTPSPSPTTPISTTTPATPTPTSPTTSTPTPTPTTTSTTTPSSSSTTPTTSTSTTTPTPTPTPTTTPTPSPTPTPTPTPTTTPTTPSPTTSTSTTTPATELSAPLNLTAVNKNSFRVDLTWGAPSNAVGIINYRITRLRSEHLATAAYNTINVADVSASSSLSTYSYSDVNVGPDYTFIYKVMSYDGQNYSLPSNDATVTTSFTKTTCLTHSNSSNLSLKGYTTTADGGSYEDTCLSPSIVQGGVNIKQSNCDSSIGAADPILGRAFRISMNYCGSGCSDGACISSSTSISTTTPTPTPTPTPTSTSTPTPLPPPVPSGFPHTQNPDNPYFATVNSTQYKSFSTMANLYPDPNGDTVKAVFDWGDGTTSGPTVGIIPESAGTGIGGSHSWSAVGIYNVKVKAVDSTGLSSDWSESDAVPVGISPNLPVLTKATANGLDVILEWTESSTDVTGFRLYYLPSSGGDGVRYVADGSARTYTYSMPAAGTYTFFLKACNLSSSGSIPICTVTSNHLSATVPSSSTSFLDLRAKNLAAILSVLESLKVLVEKLLNLSR